MLSHPLADLAWKFHEFTLRPLAREWVRAQCRTYVQMCNDGSSPRPDELLQSLASQYGPSAPLTLPEKVAFLVGLHEIVCTGEAKLHGIIWPNGLLDKQLMSDGLRWGVIANLVAEKL